jgi:hypothetical protein
MATLGVHPLASAAGPTEQLASRRTEMLMQELWGPPQYMRGPRPGDLYIRRARQSQPAPQPDRPPRPPLNRPEFRRDSAHWDAARSGGVT